MPADGSNTTPPSPVALTKKAERYCAAAEVERGPRRAARAKVDHTLTNRMKAAVERLEALADEIVAKLDELYGDPDREPVLGAPEPIGRFRPSRRDLDQTDWARGPDVEEREIDADYEPSLGSVAANGGFDQQRWAAGATGDVEDEHDGREPSEDLELECEDEGAQCEDEGHDSDREPDCDAEGDAQAICHHFPTHTPPWPPVMAANDAVEPPHGR